MAVIKQNDDGSVSVYTAAEGQEVFTAGGPAASASTPRKQPGTVIKLNANGGTDTGGGLTSWKNNLGYDVIAYDPILDVTTAATGACTASFGQTATSGTTSSSNFISGQDVHTATGTFTPGTPVSVKVHNGDWVTGSKASGASAGLVANLYFSIMPV